MSGPVHVRPARSDDRAACLRMWEALHAEQAALDPSHRLAPDAPTRWGNDFGEWVRSQADAVLVAEREGALVGPHHGPPAPPGPALRRPPAGLAGRPLRGARRAGPRRGFPALLDAAEAFARDLGADAVEAGIRAANAPMRAVWARRGGREAAVAVEKALR